MRGEEGPSQGEPVGVVGAGTQPTCSQEQWAEDACRRQAWSYPSPGQSRVGISPGPPVPPACISRAVSLSPLSSLPCLLAAPPVKGKRKQSEEGDPLDPPVSPKPCGEHSRSQSPVGLEVSWGTPLGHLPAIPSPGSTGHLRPFSFATGAWGRWAVFQEPTVRCDMSRAS